MNQKRPHPVAQGVDGGLVARFEQNHGGGDDLVVGEPVAAVDHLDQVRDQRPVWDPALGLDERLRVVDQFARGPVGSGPRLVRRPQLVHLDDGVGPVEQPPGVAAGHAQHRADHRHREGLGVVGQQVEGPHLPALAHQFPGQGADGRFERGHRAGREDLGHQPPDAGVIGGLQAQQRPPLVLVEGGPARVRLGLAELGGGVAVVVDAAQAAVPQGLVNVGEPGEHPMAGPLVAEHRGRFPEPAQGRVGVIYEGGVVEVKGVGEAL